MRRFNPEKELKKIEKGNRNKILYSIITLLLIIAVGSTYALYQVRHTQKLVFNTVGEFKKRDIYLSVLVDGETKAEFPGKNDGYVFDNIQCDKPGIKASFNNDAWELTLTTKTTNKCTVKFITKPYIDDSGANYPDLFQGLIPIRYDNNKIYIADYKEKWYDYNNHEWANAVLIDHDNPEVMNKFYTDGKLNINTEITTDDILQMYVWIPRYKYQLFNVGLNGTPKQIINIKFENTIETTGEVSCTYTDMKDGTVLEDCKNVENGNWYTHPAFTFGDTQLRGIWVGKFEPSDPTDPNGRTNGNKINEITILPGKTSMVLKNISTMFNEERNIELQKATKYNLNSTEIDTRMMKNIEWGAVAYLTQSVYGIYKDEKTCNIDDTTFEQCEVWINNSAQGAGITEVKNNWGGSYTGCVGDKKNAGVIWNDADDGSVAKCAEGNRWNEKGVKASTTGNMYGIYDMVGGAWEYIMGAIVNQTGGGLYIARAGFQLSTIPENKYYDMYTFGDNYLEHERGHLGDATRETLQTFGNAYGGWNNDHAFFPAANSESVSPWIRRGGLHYAGSTAGIFSFYWYFGSTDPGNSFRSVLSAA